MGARIRRRSPVVAAAALSVFLSLVVAGVPAVQAAPAPSIKLISSSDTVKVQERSKGGIGLDLGVWVASTNGDFQIRISRPDLLTDVTAAQTATDGTVLRDIPIDDLVGWEGLAKFLHVSIKDADGKAVWRYVGDWCPDGWDEDRIDDTGPINPTYPQWCGGNAFTLGMVWGIDRGWAENPLPWFGVPATALPRGTYDVRVWIDPDYASLFQIAPEDAETHVALHVVRHRTPTARHGRSSSLSATTASVPIDDTPPADSIPDLAALPAWGIRADDRNGRDYVAFGATVWNAGPAPMIVEGYRQPGQDVMDGWQYFTDPSGSVIGKAHVGRLEYDARPGHEHWHFEQFANYALTDATKTEIVRSEKVSFCLAPTDPIDLLAQNAEWSPWETGLFSACGGSGSLWTRESLPVGWGDTYFQWLPGQSLDITHLPNGKYFIRVWVNPLGAMFETSSANDVSYRRVLLRGRPGDRRVVVPPYHGIDTEGCFRCSFAAGGPPYDGMT